MDIPELTVILPAYNVGPFLEESLAILPSYLDGTGLPYEIIVVNDGSTDGTARCLMAVNNNRIRVFTLPSNQGKGAAIKRGIESAKGRYIVTTDADIPYGTESILRCYKALQEGALLAIGDRTLPESRNSVPIPLVRRLLSSIYSVLVKPMLYSSGLRDIQCGLKGFQSGFAKELLRYSKVDRFAFDLEFIVFAIENRIPIARLPVMLMRNKTSSMRIPVDPLNMFKDFLQIVWSKWRGYYS